MLTVLRAASNAAGPVCRTSSGADRIVVELEVRDVGLRVDDVLDQPVGRVAAVGREEHVTVRAVDVGAAAEDRDHPGEVAVADVVLGAVGAKAVAVRGEDHVGRVDVGAVRLLGEPEGEDRTVWSSSSAARRRAASLSRLPDRSEPEDRDLPRVPVDEPVEGGDLVERADPLRVPALLGAAVRVARRRQQGCEDPLALDELEEVGVPGVLAVVLLEHRLAALLEELDRRRHQPAPLGVEAGPVIGRRVEQQPLHRGGRRRCRAALDRRHRAESSRHRQGSSASADV